MIKDGLAVTLQMFIELDRALFGPTDQLLEPPLALDQWQAAQIVAVMPDQVEREQHRFMSAAFTPQRVEARCPVGAGDHCFAVDDERRRASEVFSLWHRRPMEVHDFPIRAALGDNKCNTSWIAKGLAIQHAG